MLNLIDIVDEFGYLRTLNKLSTRYNIPRRTVRGWKQIEDEGFTLHSNGGRPYPIDKISKNTISEAISHGKAINEPLDHNDMVVLVAEEYDATATRRNHVPSVPSNKLVQSVIDNVGAVSRKPQLISKARQEACSDIRMTHSVWIMIKACTENLLPQLFWNWDATQFQITSLGKNKNVYTLKLEDDLERLSGTKRPLTLIGETTTDIFVKWMHMGSAAGEAIPFVLLFEISEMKNNAFEVFEVPGLGHSPTAGSLGYLCFCHSRAGNEKFFTWFINSIVIPTINNCRSHYGIEIDENKTINLPAGMFNGDALVTFDGEQIILDQVLEKSTRDELNKNRIRAARYGASLSGKDQPADVSPLFRACKTHLRAILNKCTEVQNPIVENAIRCNMNILESKHDITIASETKNKIVYACLMIQVAVQDVIRPRFITAGFSDCGQYPLNFNTMIKRCYTKITHQQAEIMRSATEEDVIFFKEHGHLSEAQMDKSGIPKLENPSSNIPRDERQLNHQRSVLVSHDETLKRQADYVNAGLPLGNAILDSSLPKAGKQQLKKDAKLVAAEEKKEKKKKADQDRRAALTAEEKKEEAAAKKQTRENNRKEKEKTLAAAQERLKNVSLTF